MGNHIAEEAMLPVTNKLVALAQLFDGAALGPDGLDEGGFFGVAEMLRSIDKEISDICAGLDGRFAELSKGSK
jgi:hypothetical protein